MRAKRNAVLLCAALALGSLALPSAAAAKPGWVRVPPSFSFSLQLPRTAGYRLTAASIGHGEFMVRASRGLASAAYTAPAVATRRGVRGDFGRFGRIDVRFEQREARRIEPPYSDGCKGPESRELRGVASGTVRFRGRHGFVTVSRQRVEARVVRSFALLCPQVAGRRGAEEGEVDTLFAQRRAGGEEVELSASNLQAASDIVIGYIQAHTLRQIDGVRVEGAASQSPRDAQLAISHRGERPATARVIGSGAFSGEARFRQLAGGEPEWRGSLRVSLPGEGSVPLSGSGFRAAICHAPRERAERRCPLQSSGSHSQSLFAARLSWSR